MILFRFISFIYEILSYECNNDITIQLCTINSNDSIKFNWFILGGLEGVEEGDETVEMEEEEVPVPKVDPDGWETVVRGTKKTGKKK